MNKLKLLYIKLKQNKWINKYTITLLIFAIIIIFVDDNSLIDRYKAYLEKRELQKEKAKYEENIKKDQEFLDAIQSNPEELEKFAREEYKMKGKNEDVYIIKED
jgi:cell division protein FtsB